MFYIYNKLFRTKKTLQSFKNELGKPVIKERVISQINILNEIKYKPDTIVVDNKTWEDLEMNDVFEFIDRTYTKTGEQYFYNLLHTKQSKDNQKVLNNKVKFYQKNIEQTFKIVDLLKKYNSKTSYSLPKFLFEDSSYKIPMWTIIFNISSLLLGVFTLFNKDFFIYFIAIGIINTSLHYYFKRLILIFHYDFLNIKSFYPLLRSLSKYDNGEFIFSKNNRNKLRRIYKKLSYLNTNIEYADELTSIVYYIIEILKGWFLIDTLLFNNTMSYLKRNTLLLRKIYYHIGLIDTSISIVSIKKGTKGCTPVFNNKRELTIKNAYHPIIRNCIENSIFLTTKGAVITGGNMSGKTTLLKIIGINVILSQTINYSFCDEIILPHLNVISSIKNEDDLNNGKSFFMSELFRAKQILKSIDSNRFFHLILIDEIFKGTNSKDRIALASSFLIHMNKPKCIVIATTHDLEVVSFIKEKFNTFFFDNSFDNNNIIFDYILREGIQNETNVIELIKSIGFPNEIISSTNRINCILKKAHNKV